MLPTNATFDLYHSVRTSGTDKHAAAAYSTGVPGLLMPAAAEVVALEASEVPASELYTVRMNGNPGIQMEDKLVDTSDGNKVYIVTGIRLTRTRYLPNVRLTVRRKWSA